MLAVQSRTPSTLFATLVCSVSYLLLFMAVRYSSVPLHASSGNLPPRRTLVSALALRTFANFRQCLRGVLRPCKAASLPGGLLASSVPYQGARLSCASCRAAKYLLPNLLFLSHWPPRPGCFEIHPGSIRASRHTHYACPFEFLRGRSRGADVDNYLIT